MLYYFLGSPPPLWGQGSLSPHFPSSQLVPSHSPCSLSLPSLPLAPLAPSCSPLTANGQCRVVVCYTMFRGSYHLCWCKGQAGSEREWGEQEGVRGARGSKRGVRGSVGSKTTVILGFKAPTTCSRKKLWWWHVVHHLEVQSRPNVHSHSCKRPS